jgi:hypothetical protein
MASRARHGFCMPMFWRHAAHIRHAEAVTRSQMYVRLSESREDADEPERTAGPAGFRQDIRRRSLEVSATNHCAAPGLGNCESPSSIKTRPLR